MGAAHCNAAPAVTTAANRRQRSRGNSDWPSARAPADYDDARLSVGSKRPKGGSTNASRREGAARSRRQGLGRRSGKPPRPALCGRCQGSQADESPDSKPSEIAGSIPGLRSRMRWQKWADMGGRIRAVSHTIPTWVSLPRQQARPLQISRKESA